MMPNNNQEYQPQPYQQPGQAEIIISNIIRAVVCIFIIVVSFFVIVLLVSSLETQTAVDYTTYNETFVTTAQNVIGSAPGTQIQVYTSNPLLSSFTIDQYRPGFGHIWSTSNPADYTYTSQNTSMMINSPTWFTGDSYAVSANTDYSTSPHLSVLTMWSIALIIMSIAGIFGIFAYSRYKKQQQQMPPYLR